MPKYRIEPVNKKSIEETTYFENGADDEIARTILYRFGSFIVECDEYMTTEKNHTWSLEDDFDSYEFEVLSDNVEEDWEYDISDSDFKKFKEAYLNCEEEIIGWDVSRCQYTIHGDITFTPYEEEDE